jgi:hypothetical protein
MPDYSQGKIYEIRCNITHEVYFGSTTYKYLSSRLAKHKGNTGRCSSKQIIDRGNFTCKIIEEYPCNSRLELQARESYYIRNNECINKRIPRLEHQQDDDNGKFTCDCGSKVLYYNRERHYNTKKHLDCVTNK